MHSFEVYIRICQRGEQTQTELHAFQSHVVKGAKLKASCGVTDAVEFST